MFKQWCLIEWKVIAAELLFHRILYECICVRSKDTCFQYLGFPSTDVVYFCGNGQFSFGPSCIFISYQLWVNGKFWNAEAAAALCTQLYTSTKRNGQIFTMLRRDLLSLSFWVILIWHFHHSSATFQLFFLVTLMVEGLDLWWGGEGYARLFVWASPLQACRKNNPFL